MLECYLVLKVLRLCFREIDQSTLLLPYKNKCVFDGLFDSLLVLYKFIM